VFNYPNPFTTHTSFCFDHNQPCCGLDVQIKIFTISGRMIKTIRQNVTAEGFRVDKDIIIWDGRDDFGDKLAKGVYIYQIKVTGSNGSSAEKFEKLVIL
jgi:flagellar hook assembly protein FlgD